MYLSCQKCLSACFVSPLQPWLGYLRNIKRLLRGRSEGHPPGLCFHCSTTTHHLSIQTIKSNKAIWGCLVLFSRTKLNIECWILLAPLPCGWICILKYYMTRMCPSVCLCSFSTNLIFEQIKCTFRVSHLVSPSENKPTIKETRLYCQKV